MSDEPRGRWRDHWMVVGSAASAAGAAMGVLVFVIEYGSTATSNALLRLSLDLRTRAAAWLGFSEDQASRSLIGWNVEFAAAALVGAVLGVWLMAAVRRWRAPACDWLAIGLSLLALLFPTCAALRVTLHFRGVGTAALLGALMMVYLVGGLVAISRLLAGSRRIVAGGAVLCGVVLGDAMLSSLLNEPLALAPVLGATGTCLMFWAEPSAERRPAA